MCVRLIPGMGVPTVTAARMLKGQLGGRSGEETDLVMDTFPHLALSKVRGDCHLLSDAYLNHIFMESLLNLLIFGSRRHTTWTSRCLTAPAPPRLTFVA